MDGYLRVCRRCGEEEEAVLIRSRRSSEVDGGEVRLICLPVCPGGGVRVLDWGRFFAGFWKVLLRPPNKRKNFGVAARVEV